MKKSPKIILICILVTAGLIFSLWPLTSHQWDIPPQPQTLAEKQNYLASLQKTALTRRPNVILIVADDLGYFDVGVNHRAKIPTPNIDHIAQSGIYYSEAYASNQVCAPSRASFLTGRYQNRFGFESQPMPRYVKNNFQYWWARYVLNTGAMKVRDEKLFPTEEAVLLQGLPPSEITLADQFKALGYATGIFGKWHLGYQATNHPHVFGFDEQYGFIDAFTLYANEDDPNIVNHHNHLFWEKHQWEQQRNGPSCITHNGKAITEKTYITDAIMQNTTAFMRQATAKHKPFFAYVPFSAPHSPYQALKADYDALPNFNDQNQRVYYAMIRRLDWAVGQILKTVQQLGIEQNTLIIFTSDNGAATYTGAPDNGPLRSGKMTQFEGGIRVPLMISWPSQIPAGVTYSDPVILTDLMPSIAKQLGIPLAHRDYDGIDILTPAIHSQALPDRTLVWRTHNNHAIRHQDWKLFYDSKRQYVKLYNLKTDPSEKNNVAHDHPAVVQDLMTRIKTWEKSMMKPLWPNIMDYLDQSNGEETPFAI